MKYVVKAEMADNAGGTAMRRVLAGPATGTDSCEISLLELAPNMDAGDLLAGTEERLLFILSGQVEVTFGDEREIIRRDDCVFLPRGRAFRVHNAASESATLLDIQARESIAVPKNVETAGEASLVALVHRLRDNGFRTHSDHQAEGQPFDVQHLVNRGLGSRHLKVFASLVKPGSGMGLHIHPFDQFYFVLDGTLDLQVGLRTASAGPNDLVIFPAGVVHRNLNSSPDPVLQLTINAPEQPAGQQAAYDVVLTEKRSG
jgi:mannose-6-phosphate isomerase-like protein (cupin superfamily)